MTAIGTPGAQLAPDLSGWQPVNPYAAPREKDPHRRVEIEIAAAVIVAVLLARRYLAAEKPQTPTLREQADRAWRKAAPTWLRFAIPAITQAYRLGKVEGLGDDEILALATDYANHVGDYINTTSADALAEGMNTQLSAKWNENLAWARASAAYGLDKRDMRAYLAGLMRQNTMGADPVPTTARMVIDKAMMARANRIGVTEAANAEQTGPALAWLWLYRQGRLPPDSAKQWLLGPREHHCPICLQLNKQLVRPDQPFTISGGAKFWSPLAHPNCDCHLRLYTPVAKAADVAGICLVAADTGRVLMIQRENDPKDPAGGMWEFAGGHVEASESLLDGAKREWEEEVHQRLPGDARLTSQWHSGVYTGFVLKTAHEASVQPHRRGRVVNPDDPHRHAVEAIAWWDPGHLARNPAVRPELRDSLRDMRNAVRVTLHKAYDPREKREPKGSPHGGRWTKVEQREAERPSAPQTEEPNPFAPTGGPDPFAATANPFASTANPFAATVNPFTPTTDQPNPFTATPAGKPFMPAPRRTLTRQLIVLPRPPRPPDEPAPGRAWLYLPLAHVGDYYHDHGEAVGHTIDFGRIRRYMADVRHNHNPIRLQAGGDEWDVVTPLEVSESDWNNLVLPSALPLFHEAYNHPDRYADSLSSAEWAEVSQRAGVTPDVVEDLVAEGAYDEADEAVRSSALEAFADYMTWWHSEELGTVAFTDENNNPVEVDGQQFRGLLEKTIGVDNIDDYQIPEILGFYHGLAASDSPDDLRGNYNIPYGGYRSALHEFGNQTPPGLIGLSDYVVQPDIPPRGGT